MFPQAAVGYTIYRNVRVYRIASVYRITRVYRIARVYRIDRVNQRIERKAHSLTDLTPSAPGVHSLKSYRLHTTQLPKNDFRRGTQGGAAMDQLSLYGLVGVDQSETRGIKVLRLVPERGEKRGGIRR